ncbi:MAG: nitroreductase/quinone reductase family protein [Rubrobacteraceae bacterium]
MSLARWFYRGGRPNRVARILNRGGAVAHALGIAPNYLVTLEVPGRKSGRTISFPLVMAVVGDERYLVSMLGEEVNWVRNVRAAGGNATLRHGRREEVCLEEVAPENRAPILRAYLKLAPGARPHIPVDRNAPLDEFEEVAPRFPVFRVVSKSDETPRRTRGEVIVFGVKLVHSVIFLSIAASILHVFYAGVTGRGSRWTGVSLAVALGESAIFAGNGWRCPLTKVAEDFGADSGQVTDIFLPKWFADRIPQIFTPPLLIGTVALLWRRLRRRRP